MPTGPAQWSVAFNWRAQRVTSSIVVGSPRAVHGGMTIPPIHFDVWRTFDFAFLQLPIADNLAALDDAIAALDSEAIGMRVAVGSKDLFGARPEWRGLTN